MSRKIGDVLARTFREVCEENNSNKRLAEYNYLSNEEIIEICDILKKIDNEHYDMINVLNKYIKLEEGEERE